MIKLSDIKKNVELQPHQERVMDKLRGDIPGLILVHRLGGGKTLSSIAATENMTEGADVVVPASLRTNYQKEIEKFTHDPKTYDIKSYTAVANDSYLSPSEKKILILDEAHRLRERTTKAIKNIEDVSGQYGKRLLLTGTPIVNRPSDLVSLLNIASSGEADTSNFDERFVGEKRINPGLIARLMGITPGYEESMKNKPLFKKQFAKYFDYHHGSNEGFPGVENKKVKIEMTPEQHDIYMGLLKKDPVLAYKVRKNLPPNKTESKNLNAFLAAVRQVSNTPASYVNDSLEIAAAPKLKAIVDHVVKKSGDDNYKAVIYSNFLESGIDPIKDALDAEGVSTAIFNGKLNDKQRKKAVDDYNSGKVKTLLVSGAGSEGLDLKGTTEMHVVEPHWNDARIDQVIGRAARYRSHTHLPKEKQKLVVYKYQSDPRQNFIQKLLRQRDSGADEYLEGLSEKKTKLNEQFLEAIKEASMIKIAPFKSKAQQRFMFAAEARGEIEKGTAKRWADHTKNIKNLPEHVKKAMCASFGKIAVELKRLPPVPKAILEQQEAQMVTAEKRKGLSPAAARTANTAKIT